MGKKFGGMGGNVYFCTIYLDVRIEKVGWHEYQPQVMQTFAGEAKAND